VGQRDSGVGSAPGRPIWTSRRGVHLLDGRQATVAPEDVDAAATLEMQQRASPSHGFVARAQHRYGTVGAGAQDLPPGTAPRLHHSPGPGDH